MKQVNGSIVRDLRKKMNLTQEEFAEKVNVSVRNLYRIESNNAHVDMFQYINMLHIFDQPIENIDLLFLSSVEYDEFNKYKTCLTYLSGGDKPMFEETLNQLKKCKIYEHPYVKQHIDFAMVSAHYHIESEKHGDEYEQLIAIMKQTIKNFDEKNISKYIFATNEISILDRLVLCLINKVIADPSNMQDGDHALEILDKMAENKHFMAHDKLANVITLDRRAMVLSLQDKHEEALKLFYTAFDIGLDQMNYVSLSYIPLNMASSYFQMGAPLSEYLPLIKQGYYLLLLCSGEEHQMTIQYKNAIESLFNIDPETF